MDELPQREQRLLLLRFYGELSQAEIGARLGVSQMHVSRLLSQAISYLRERLMDQTHMAHRPTVPGTYLPVAGTKGRKRHRK